MEGGGGRTEVELPRRNDAPRRDEFMRGRLGGDDDEAVDEAQGEVQTGGGVEKLAGLLQE